MRKLLGEQSVMCLPASVCLHCTMCGRCPSLSTGVPMSWLFPSCAHSAICLCVFHHSLATHYQYCRRRPKRRPRASRHSLRAIASRQCRPPSNRLSYFAVAFKLPHFSASRWNLAEQLQQIALVHTHKLGKERLNVEDGLAAALHIRHESGTLYAF